MKIYVSFFALLLVACGGSQKQEAVIGAETIFGSQKLKIINGSLEITKEKIQGTGSVVFGNSSEEIKSGASYALDIQLQDAGNVVLVTNSNENLLGGYEVDFRRNGAGTGSLIVSLAASGSRKNTINKSGFDVFSGFNAADLLKFQIDVHNNETPSHTLIWSRALGDNFSEDFAILNTEDDVEKSAGSPGVGTGVHWGLVLRNASITLAEKSAPKFSE